MEKEKNREKKPKISMAEIVLIGLLLAMVDFFQALSLLVSPFPVIGQVALGLSTTVGLCVILLVQFYLTMKRVGSPWFLATGATPTRLLAWLGMCFVINNPKLEKVAKVASKLAV